MVGSLTDMVVFQYALIYAARQGNLGDIPTFVVTTSLIVGGRQLCSVFLKALGAAGENGHASTLACLLTYKNVASTLLLVHDVRPMIAATKGGHLECVKLLIAHGATPRRNPGCVFAAAGYNHPAVLAHLLSREDGVALIDLVLPKRWTVLRFACERGFTKCVNLLLAHGVDITTLSPSGETCIGAAVRNNRVAVLASLLSADAGTVATLIDQHGDGDCTPLLDAVKRRQPQCVRLLIEHGADIAATTAAAAGAETCLVLAVQMGAADVLSVLLTTRAAIALINCVCKNTGVALLHIASSRSEHGSACLQTLIERGADLTILSTRGYSCIDIAIRRNDGYLLSLLLAATPKTAIAALIDRPDATDLNLKPLLCAVVSNRLICMQLLLDYGADVTVVSALGDSCIDIAVNNQNPRMVAALLSPRVEGAISLLDRVNPVDGLTPLMFASYNGCLPCATVLLEHGADMAIVTDDERALDCFTVRKKVHREPMMRLLRYYKKARDQGLFAAPARPPARRSSLTAHVCIPTGAVFRHGSWRPRSAGLFPAKMRAAIRTMQILATARPLRTSRADRHAMRGRFIVVRYPQACLTCLPEEIRQYVYSFVASGPVPSHWLKRLPRTGSTGAP